MRHLRLTYGLKVTLLHRHCRNAGVAARKLLQPALASDTAVVQQANADIAASNTPVVEEANADIAASNTPVVKEANADIAASNTPVVEEANADIAASNTPVVEEANADSAAADNQRMLITMAEQRAQNADLTSQRTSAAIHQAALYNDASSATPQGDEVAVRMASKLAARI
jgi:hypothetical protein